MTLVERLGAALERGRATQPVLLTGDHRDLDERDNADLTPAAVLVAVTDRARPGVLLTQRTDTLRNHAGQVAFPGGRIDPGESAIAAALREADEEIALAPASVVLVGEVDRYRTVTGFSVTPVLAVVPPDLPLVPSEAEVASVFEVPLDFLLDPANQVEASAQWQGRTRHYYEIRWADRRIWGATAAMIVNLSRQLAWH
ncbi:8-oxo-dGTP pyrophosphatase MutT (NUDIX family) [Sphingomonas insulae]|uniref:Nudix hydrolase domain-containing protein n=1 Tax=Sphingomonas insulae TaxID=424800 RepID=A0ABN1HNM3_9SPHN|nr:CoA pyrophosphatase [Sphingomonas insulae]NIJ30825.1 8-oxo-dGTP pyrophosphatase MutT (NUDIX family) [Sphingomonas insulae]